MRIKPSKYVWKCFKAFTKFQECAQIWKPIFQTGKFQRRSLEKQRNVKRSKSDDYGFALHLLSSKKCKLLLDTGSRSCLICPDLAYKYSGRFINKKSSTLEQPMVSVFTIKLFTYLYFYYNYYAKHPVDAALEIYKIFLNATPSQWIPSHTSRFQ